MEKTPEERLKEFIDGFGKLREQTKFDIAAYPIYQPNEKGTFDLSITMRPVDIATEPVKSPFIA